MRRTAGAAVLTAVSVLDVCQAASQTVQQVLTVSAVIEPGCWTGRGRMDQTSFGLIDFGELYDLDRDIDVVSSVGSGTIVFQCTAGTHYRVEIDDGLYAAGQGERRLKSTDSGDNTTLRYELFQDSGYRVRWGQSAFALSGVAAGRVEELAVYARIMASPVTPKPGEYTDTLVVTINY